MNLILRLHVDMFAGQAGNLVLSGVGLILALSLVSGAVLYGALHAQIGVRQRAPPRLGAHGLAGLA